MSEELSKKNFNNVGPLEESSLDWQRVLQELKVTFGNDVYESWIKNINLIKEFNHYVILSAPTRFVRDWIVSRYVDQLLDKIKNSKDRIFFRRTKR